jgi:hypothetical protein
LEQFKLDRGNLHNPAPPPQAEPEPEFSADALALHCRQFNRPYQEFVHGKCRYELGPALCRCQEAPGWVISGRFGQGRTSYTLLRDFLCVGTNLNFGADAKLSYEGLIGVACPGPVDRWEKRPTDPVEKGPAARIDFKRTGEKAPFRYKFEKEYWPRWKHARRCVLDNRSNGKVKCEADFTEEQAEGLKLEKLAICWAIVARKNCPRILNKKPVRREIVREFATLSVFLLWLVAGVRGELEFCPSSPQERKESDEYGIGWAPFHPVTRGWAQLHPVTRPDEDEERRLAKLAKAGDVIAGNMLIAAHVWIAKEIAREFRNFHGAELDDLVQEGVFGLIKTIAAFDPELGYRFETLARLKVRRAMQDYMRDLRRQTRHDSTDALADAGMERVLGMYRQISVDYSPGNIK